MAFTHNDIVNKNRLRGALNEESSMGFQHNDIVTVDAMNKAIAEGGGGGGEPVTWLLEDATATVEYNEDLDMQGAFFDLSGVLTADTLYSTFAGKQAVTIVNGTKIEAPTITSDDPVEVSVYCYDPDSGNIFPSYIYNTMIISIAGGDEGNTVTFSLGVVEE